MRLFPKALILGFILLSLSTCEDDRINLGVAAPPVIPAVPVKFSAQPGTFTLTANFKSGLFGLSTNTGESFTWILTSKPDWLTITPTSGTSANLSQYQVNTANLFSGTQVGTVIVTATTAKGQTGKVEIPVSVEGQESTAVTVAPSTVFNYDENTKGVIIRNNSNVPINWQLESSASYLAVIPNSGHLNPNESVPLNLTAYRAVPGSQNFVEHLSIKVEGVKISEVPVGVVNIKPLTGQIIDAEYHRASDRLYFVTDEKKLYRFSSLDQGLANWPLPPETPTCISVGVNGLKGVVGYNGAISVVDLATLRTDVSYNLSANVLDVVFAPNNWAYVIPKTNQFTPIRCIDLQTGAEISNAGNGVYGGLRAKLHPSGDYIYIAGSGMVEKYDIRGGQATRLYINTTPFNPPWSIGQDLWLTDDGARMFASQRDSFWLTTTQATDMVYTGVTIPGTYQNIRTLDHITTTNRICVILNKPTEFDAAENLVRIFTGDLLSSLGTKPLPDFVMNVSGTVQYVPAEGRFGFFNSDGTKFIVLVKSKTLAGVTDQWAVVTVSL